MQDLEISVDDSAFSTLLIKDFSLQNMIRAQEEEELLADQLAKNDSMSSRYLNIIAKHCVSNEAANDLWNFIRSMHIDRQLKSYKTIYSRVKQKLPDIKMSFELREKISKETQFHIGDVYPEKLYPKSKFETLSEWTCSSLSEIWGLHQNTHSKQMKKNPEKKYDLSVDGVPLSNSGVDKMTLVCIRFKGCRTIYLAGVYVYREGFKMDLNDYILQYIIEARNDGFNLNVVIADSPAR